MITLKLPKKAGLTATKAAKIFQRVIKERCNLPIAISSQKTVETKVNRAAIVLEIDASIGKEGFKIEDGKKGEIKITGNDGLGLLYGTGKFLRESKYSGNTFTPAKWRGISIPEKEVRIIYFATHFHNYYHDAPVKDFERYIEDLSLWGYNAVLVWFDMHHFNGINDPSAKKMINRLKLLLRAAKKIGLKAGIVVLGNEAYANSPENLRLTPPTQFKLRGMFGVELCPNKPGAKELMLKWFIEEFNAFADIGIDYLSIWPYDQGGCSCEKCRPWGANGFLLMAKEISKLARKILPNVKIMLSTWLFDALESEGEWEGLSDELKNRPSWLDYIVADSHTDFPKYPLENEMPGNFPLLNFPEISMWGAGPWGGFGANPAPERFQGLWNQVKHLVSGGFPYSEGIFEDINKAIYSQFYWKKNKKAIDSLKEYIAYEYSPSVVIPVVEAVKILEESLPRKSEVKNGVVRFLINNPKNIDKAFSLIRKTDAKLPKYAKSGWRWRILYLRAFIDYELAHNDFKVSEKCNASLEELTTIFHVQKGAGCVAPPTRKTIKKYFLKTR